MEDGGCESAWLHMSEMEAPIRDQMPFLGASFRGPRFSEGVSRDRQGVGPRRRGKVCFLVRKYVDDAQI